ncbi:MAG: AtpZ/AtpI family protein [Deltaproteobacteria bacterium]|nr:AtpZ/AtpI family protein [Deltaproteobacteria bacterium]
MKRETRRYIRELGYFSSLGFSISLSVVIGLAIGVYLDRHVFYTTPWLTLIGLGLGIAAGYRNIGLAIANLKTSHFAQSLRPAKILILEILHVFLWLKF